MPTTTIAVEAGEKPFQDAGGAKRMTAVTGMQAIRTRPVQRRLVQDMRYTATRPRKAYMISKHLK